MIFFNIKDDHPCTNQQLKVTRRDDGQLLLSKMWSNELHNVERKHDMRNKCIKDDAMWSELSTLISSKFGINMTYKKSPYRIPNYNDYCIMYDGRKISFVDTYEWLGIDMDLRLQFENFQWEKIQQFRFNINNLNTFGNKYGGASRKVRKQLYCENICPKILYCMSLWFGCESKYNILIIK